MTTVVDASVAVKMVVEEEGSAEAVELIETGEALVAPDLVLVEAGNALWNKVRTSQLLETHARDNLASLPAFFDRLWPSADLVGRAFEIAFQLRHPLYDCVYLALAEQLDAPLVTADLRFAHRCEGSRFASRVRALVGTL